MNLAAKRLLGWSGKLLQYNRGIATTQSPRCEERPPSLEKSEVQQRTQWHRISVFKPFLRNTVHQHMRKGSRVLVQGRLVYGEVTDAKGVGHITSTVVADEVVFLGRSAKEENAESETVASSSFQ
uniref:Putative single-stranded dna-binding protein mitochondrial n=1 Tax=Ixodes ricinus TaxID=34613 RepID=A0A6B0UQ26_IXORI